jgi:predicted nucleic-acid-binding Zn-ribbon protein
VKRSGKCPKCGCANVIADAKAQDRGHFDAAHEMSVVTFRHPEAMIFKGSRQSNVSAWVCAACGFVEFYADTPASLTA